jgi:hypothetical protein
MQRQNQKLRQYISHKATKARRRCGKGRGELHGQLSEMGLAKPIRKVAK